MDEVLSKKNKLIEIIMNAVNNPISLHQWDMFSSCNAIRVCYNNDRYKINISGMVELYKDGCLTSNEFSKELESKIKKELSLWT